jgi:hypothetical protein
MSDEASGVGFGVRKSGAGADAEEVLIDQTDGIAAGLFRVPIGIEFSLDVGSFGPFPEAFFEFGLGVGLIEGKPLLFEGKAAGDEVAATEGDNIGEERADVAQVRSGVFGDRSGLGGGGEAGGDPVDEVVHEWGDWVWVGCRSISGFIGGKFEGRFTELPAAESEFAVVGEVLLADRLAGEVSCEDGLDFGEGVEPGEQGVTEFAVAEALVELEANITG